MQLLRSLHAALGAAGGQSGLGGRESLALEIFLEERQVRLDFARHFALGGAAAEEVGQSVQESPHGYAPSESSFSTRPDIFRQRAVSSASAFLPALVME
jgi:hypothetical protein